MLKRENRFFKSVSILLLSAAVMSGCGSSQSKTSLDSAGNSAVYNGEISNAEMGLESAAAADTADVAEASGGMPENTAVDIISEQRKLIKNIEISAETQDGGAVLEQLESKTGELQGYVEYLDSSAMPDSGGTNRYMEMIVRIPAGEVDRFVTEVEKLAVITARKEHVQDVTMEYVDLESHKKMLLAEQESLLKLLESASGLDEIIVLEQRLSEVRYQVESMEARLRTFNNLIEYSKVTLYINEVEDVVPVEEKSASARILSGFSNSVSQIGFFFRELGIVLLIKSPYIFVFAVFAAAVMLIIRLIGKHNKKNSKLEEDKRELHKQQPDRQENKQEPGNQEQEKPKGISE